MELVTQQVMGTTYKTGSDRTTMKEGETMLIYAPKDKEILCAEVPKGKQWIVSLSAEVYESDAV